MRTKNLLKLALMMVAVFMFAGANAQDVPTSAGSVHDLNLVYGTPLNRDTVTIGYQAKYIAQPDTYYHPNYTAGNAWALTANFTWVWTFFASDGTTPATVTTDYVTAAGDQDNALLVTWPQVGNYVVKVAEKAPLAWGGCEDATPSTIAVAVVAAPVRVSFPYFNTTLSMTSGDTYYFCGDQAATSITISLTGYPQFGVEWTLTQQEIDESDVDVVGSPVTPLIVNYSDATGIQRLGTNDFSTRVTAQSYELENRALTMLANKRTKYTYEIKGINDLYSRKSDYLAATTYFPTVAADQTYTIIVNPTPSTGPIFHVPNNWGN